MSNLNFESLENKSPKTTSHKSPKKPAKKKQKAPVGIIVGIGIFVVLGIIFILASGGSSENGHSAKRLFQKEPNDYMKNQLLLTSRNWGVSQQKVWDFYCNHDPEGYILYVRDTLAKTDRRINDIIVQDFDGVQFVDPITGLALCELYKKYPEYEDPFWDKFKDGLETSAYFAGHGRYWNSLPIYWNEEDENF